MHEVSVCIPVFNGERFLAEAIESVLTQDYQDFELIINDDASSDGSFDVARSFRDPRIRLYRNEVSVGIPGNWNLAMARSSGRYVKYLFQDDVLYPDCLSSMLGVIKMHENVGIVFSMRDLAEEDGLRAEQFYPYLADLQAPMRRKGVLHTLNSGRKFLEDCIKCGGVFFNYIAEPSFVMFDSTLVNEVGYFDNRLRQNADYEYWLRFLFISDAYYIDRALGLFRVHKGSESSRGIALATKLRYVWEERVVIDNLASFADRTDARRISTILERRKKWFVVFRLRFFLAHRLARLLNKL